MWNEREEEMAVVLREWQHLREKPRIRLYDRHGMYWECAGRGIRQQGRSPEEAYMFWKTAYRLVAH